MIKFTSEICLNISEGQIGVSGGPWELNIRDITRWAQGITKNFNLGNLIYEMYIFIFLGIYLVHYC